LVDCLIYSKMKGKLASGVCIGKKKSHLEDVADKLGGWSRITASFTLKL